MITSSDDTIVAPATPPGVGAIAVIRLSGKDAIAITGGVFKGSDLAAQPPRTLHFGRIYEDEILIDEVVVSLYKAPASYTGEDVVEISCHGSPFIVGRLISLLASKGARHASPGEFTLRAFLNRKLDIAQAEAVADLIASDSYASHRTALAQMRGGYSVKLQKLRESLIHFASLIELELDFAEEDVDFADRQKLFSLLDEADIELSLLIESFKSGNAFKNGVPVAIVGKPNAGKSTLLNTLLNEDRAIVTDIAGTTRDTLEDRVIINGIVFRFIDTAGLRDTQDHIETIGIERSRRAMRDASIVLFMFDVTQQYTDEIHTQFEDVRCLCATSGNRLLLVANKTDLMTDDKDLNLFKNFEIIPVSAKKNMGIEKLREKLLEYIASENTPGDTVVSNARHHQALISARDALRQVKDGLINGISGDLLAADFKQTLYHLGLLTGEIHTDELLTNIFSKFCIGK